MLDYANERKIAKSKLATLMLKIDETLAGASARRIMDAIIVAGNNSKINKLNK
jgi:hypothetical protein